MSMNAGVFTVLTVMNEDEVVCVEIIEGEFAVLLEDHYARQGYSVRRSLQ